eukprot:TRINITY_DN1831_c0_g1_i17.p4 TRINITY_DN1831_c0_g1~~TRINITY_DN1831_c0_g1_i17.p4  ORF type:complete len:118 (-),score=30.57 TRINITY_DN1831_c0_g1_i17:1007-1360(-)
MGHQTIVAQLLAVGANPNKKDENMISALEEAVRLNSHEMVTSMARCGGDLNGLGASGLPLLHSSILLPDPSAAFTTMTFLLDHGAGANFRDANGQTALSLAAISDRIPLIQAPRSQI